MSVNRNRARHDYSQGKAGWYVVNHTTQIAVAGPYSRETMAENKKLAIDARYLGIGSDDLRVCQACTYAHRRGEPVNPDSKT